MEENGLYTGERFQDGEGRLYQFIMQAKHAVTKEAMAVYQELSGHYAVLTEPRVSFLKKMKACNEGGSLEKAPDTEASGDSSMNGLMEFLDAATCREKLNVLMGMEKDLDENMLNSITISLDLPITDHNFSDRLDLVKDYLHTRIRFENNRLR